MTGTLRIDVRGLPRPQGSMKLHQLPNGKTAARYPAAVYQWRAQVQQAVADSFTVPIAGAVELKLGFDLPRPAGHYLPVNSRRTAPEVNPHAPTAPTVAPDIDKLVRAVCDSITDAGLWKDDAQVVVIHAAKRYVDGSPGVLITVTELP